MRRTPVRDVHLISQLVRKLTIQHRLAAEANEGRYVVGEHGGGRLPRAGPRALRLAITCNEARRRILYVQSWEGG